MKKYQAILFDLDGTLLHMDQEPFMKALFAGEAETVSPLLGIAPETLVSVIKKGVYAMITNDGSTTGEEAFSKVALPTLGEDPIAVSEAFDSYYNGKFDEIRALAAPNPLAKKAVELARKQADLVILATNPVFPPAAQKARLSWIGLEMSDFDHVTHYQNSHYCKPNPAYYKEILETFDLDPAKCFMVGNDVKEDMIPASGLSLDCYLVKNHLIDGGLPYECYKQGSFADLVDYLENL